jgi:hypothetical protein
MFKRMGLKLHPCLILQTRGKKCVRFLPILTAHLLFVHIDFIMLYVFPPSPLSINLYSRPSCLIESKAFLKSTKHENTLPLFWFACLSIRVCRMNMWSVVRQFGKKPIWHLLSTLFSLRKCMSLLLMIMQKILFWLLLTHIPDSYWGQICLHFCGLWWSVLGSKYWGICKSWGWCYRV